MQEYLYVLLKQSHYTVGDTCDHVKLEFVAKTGSVCRCLLSISLQSHCYSFDSTLEGGSPTLNTWMFTHV